MYNGRRKKFDVRGAPQTCVPADGKRAGYESCGGVAGIYDAAAGGVAGGGVRGAGHSPGTLAVYDRGGHRAGSGIRGIYEKILSPA